ncbi:hypothetical protein ALC53_10677 [Atta colombica]|uniref:Gustatory receptor n=1 Tax=Atta colombica TaxID=520822 RepID=A0A151I032_9HYME|nr:hypothetical protein ALC53_10677 [Atta colombica]
MHRGNAFFTKGFVMDTTLLTAYQVILEFNNMDKIFVLYMNLIILQMDMLYINCICVVYHEQRNPFLLMKLKALKKQHLITSDTVQMLNTIFSLQLLAIIVITFVELTFFLYFYIFHWKIDANINHKVFDWLLLTSLMYQCIKIVLIGWACDTGKDEAMGIGTTVHEILNDTNDEQIIDELQLFSLQVLQRENTFSAKGLIVDATLLVGSYQKLSRLIHAKDIFGIIFLIIQTYSLAYKVTTHIIQLDYFTIFSGMISLYFFILTFEIIMIYINCVCVLKACFKSINDNLAHMQRLMVNDIKSCIPGLIYQRNQTLLLKLKALKKWHLRISDTVQMLNTIFVYYVVKITLLVWVCETGKNQAQEISTTVHELLNNIKDEHIKNELQLFSLQILHRKNTFSIKCLTIDAKLLATSKMEKATVVSRHGLSILNVSLFHLESYSRIISIQAQYFDLRDFEIILYSVIICVYTIINFAIIYSIIKSKINFGEIHVKDILSDMKTHASNVILHTQRNQFLLKEIEILKKQHLMISNAVKILTMIFCLSLFTVVMSFFIITFELYLYTMRWQNGVFIGMDWHFLDVFLIFLIYNIFKIILIVWACETGKNQAQKIGTTIYDLLNSTNDEQIKYEVITLKRYIFFRNYVIC